MIGRLLQSAASTFGHHGAARGPPHHHPQPGLESVTEDSHTRELLFPDRASLQQFHQHAPQLDAQQLLPGPARPATARDAANFDDRGGLDISFPGDVRLVIAQDANARYHQPQVLYDSKPTRGGGSGSGGPGSEPKPAAPADLPPGHQRALSRGKSMTSPITPSRHRHTPSGSLFSPSGLLPISPLSPRSPDKARAGSGDARPRASPFDQAFTEVETAQGKIAREAKEDTDALLGCMFGAPGFRLEPGTKLHILPKKSADQQHLGKSPGSNRPISSGGFQRKRTPLVRSTSVADVTRGASDADGRGMPSKPSIMFTRLFTVSVPETVAADLDDRDGAGPDSPVHSKHPANGDLPRPKPPKQKKVPMYAIAVILQLPPEAPSRLRPSTSQQGLSSLASSLNDSTPPTSWRGDQGVFSSFMEIKSYGAFDSVLNSHLPQVLLYWNIVNRSLELMELVAKVKLGVLLEDATPFTPLNPAPAPKPGLGKTQKPNKTTQQSVYVPAGCLQEEPTIKDMSEKTAQRIVGGLRTRRVVVGQGRWGAWREEARWIGRWAGGRDQNFFLFNVLTAFLGSHTEWLETLAPRWYRKRRRAQRSDSNIIRSRTVIVSPDKMASRRLIFLLASFLPSHLNHHQAMVNAQQNHQPPYSESPPMFPPREQGIRRAGTTRSSLGRTSGAAAAAASAVAPAATGGGGHARSVSFSLAKTSGEDAAMDEPARSLRGRRDSDARSLRTSTLVIPHQGGSESRKASMSTVIADSAQAVPHFSSLALGDGPGPVGGVAERPRPGSGGSLASLALSHNLKRSESTAGSTGGSGRWGSVVSGFWSNRRDSSTDDSDVFVPWQESPRRGKFHGPHQHEHRHSVAGLERMVEEASALRDAHGPPSSLLSGSPRRRPLQLDDCLKPRHPALSETTAGARQIPRPKKPERMPLKLSFNEDEGYIDIAMDKEYSFSSSLASSFASVRHPPALQPPLGTNGHFSPYGSIASDAAGAPHSEPALDAAGWLKVFQPDFALQAVRPYDDLQADVHGALRAEALLDAADAAADDAGAAAPGPWHDVSETLVADAVNFSVERVRVLRRRRAAGQPPPLRAAAPPGGPRVPEDPRFEVRVSSQPVMDLDPTLIDAVERVLALSGSSSRASSPQRGAQAGDGANGAAGAAANGAGADKARADGAAGPGLGAGPGLDGPTAETRRAVLGALEQVVRSVLEEGAQAPRRNESSLREGVRRWLGEVERAAGMGG